MSLIGNGAIAWVTGAGKGIGYALALALADQGWRVAVSARTLSDLEKLVAAGPVGAINAYPLDVCDAAATAVTIDRIKSDMGPIALSILNAGTHLPTPLDGFDTATLQRLVDVNLMGTAHGLVCLLKQARRGDQIAVVASLAGYRGLPGAGAYGATKAALINLTEALKPEADAAEIKLRVINPGFVDTPLTEKNEFPMPFLIPVDVATKCIIEGLAGDQFEIAFPRRFSLIMKLLRMLPDRIYFHLTRRMVAS